jgi:Cu(I)/Ag(I) efflux system membrane fusion protein
MKNIFRNKFIQLSLVLILGLIIGGLLFSNENTNHVEQGHSQEKETTYTCSMHPQIRQNEPGKCPLCGMDLIPLTQDFGNTDGNTLLLTMSPEAIALANVQTQKVKTLQSGHEITLAGKIALNEQKMSVITANYPGRIEKLHIDYTGQTIQKGQKLATIYSPDLVTAQKELIEAVRFKNANPGLYDAAKEKLRLWKITDEQIESIERSSSVINEFDVFSDLSGVVLQRNISRGDFVNKGSVLFEITDLSRLWVLLDAYESDLPFLRVGQKITFNVSSVPGKVFNSSIIFIDPIINNQTRTASVRAEISNSQLLLKPEMFVNAKVFANLPLKEKSLAIPSTALLWTGKRSVVYVKSPDQSHSAFEMREITLGPSLGDYYLVESGLSEGDEIVVYGVFSVDAAAQLAGKPSMLNKEGRDVILEHKHDDNQSGYLNTTIEKTKSMNYQANASLVPLFELYLKWKNLLVKDNFKDAKDIAVEMKNELSKVNLSKFNTEEKNTWTKFHSELNENLQHVGHFATIQEMRKGFLVTSKTMIEIAKLFKPLNETLYIQHCPMADENKGADWLSMEKEILNPYFGKSMLTCGEVTGTIKK